MNNEDLLSLIEGIDETLTQVNKDLETLTLGTNISGNAHALDKLRFAETAGKLSGELLFVKHALIDEMNRQTAKKFWQFWK